MAWERDPALGYGPFIRLQGSTSPAGDGIQGRESGEMRGRARDEWGGGLCVRAYYADGLGLPGGRFGWEFHTLVSPDPQCLPWEPHWTPGRPGVTIRVIDGEDWAVIPVTVTKIVMDDGTTWTIRDSERPNG